MMGERLAHAVAISLGTPPFKVRGLPLHRPHPPSHQSVLQLHSPELCQKSPGPIAPTLHISRACYTVRTRKILPEILSPRYYTVGQHMCESICTHVVCWIYHSRGCHRFILPMYGRVVRPCQSHKGQRHPVGTRDPHHDHVRIRDDLHRNGPQPSIHFPRR